MKKLLTVISILGTLLNLSAQNDSTKVLCTYKVEGQSPTKQFYVGYEYASPYTITGSSNFNPDAEPTYTGKSNLNTGWRIGGSFPLVDSKKWLFNLGFFYKRTAYDITKTSTDFTPHTFYERLNERGLNNLGLSLFIFKPLNNRHFLMGFVQGETSGDYTLKELPSRFQYTRVSYSLLFGWKKKPGSMFAFGVARTWRGGTAFWNPVILWNKTFNKHWGIELLLPARGAVRYNFSPKSMLLLGYELEGTSFNMQFASTSSSIGWIDPMYTEGKFEFRRSELRPRLTWEKQLYKYIWLTTQAGLRINYRNAVALNNNQPRGEYVIKNKFLPGFYALATINLVIPPK